MSPSAVRVIRWVLFIPGALAAAFVSQLIAALSQIVLAPWLAQCVIQFWMAGAFIACGSAIAPTRHPSVAIVLLCVQVVSIVAGFFLIENTVAGVAMAAQALGAASGFFYAIGQNSDDKINAELP